MKFTLLDLSSFSSFAGLEAFVCISESEIDESETCNSDGKYETRSYLDDT